MRFNFMAAHGRGLVSLALTEARMRELGLALITTKKVTRRVSERRSLRLSMRVKGWRPACRLTTVLARSLLRSPIVPVPAIWYVPAGCRHYALSMAE